MSSNFYFKKWRSLLTQLEALLDIDIQYQTEKAHDQHLSDAVYRLTMVLGRYMVLYNEAIECLHNNLQVQKTRYMENVVTALVARIIEMKEELQNLENTYYQFFGRGLVLAGRTTDDAEMTTFPRKPKRPLEIQEAIENAFERVKEIKQALIIAKLEEEAKLAEEKEQKLLFEIESSNDSDDEDQVSEESVETISPEARLRKDLIAMIIAHEKLRQVTRMIIHNKLRREAWEKELLGTAHPPARYELRQKSAKLLQRVFRAFFEIKRKRIETRERDLILGLVYCKPPNPDLFEVETQGVTKRSKLHDEYEKELLTKKDKMKAAFAHKRGAEVAEDYRDIVRAWFQEWFNSIRFIHDIPKHGCMAIIKEEAPNPFEWGEEYLALMKKKEADVGKTPQELKYEAQERKRIAQDAKKEEKLRKKAAATLLGKMMKHPTMHPGYHYPQSKKTDHLVQVIKDYRIAWDRYDTTRQRDVKYKYIPELNVENAYMEVKLEILEKITEEMDLEHQQLKQALRMDYRNNGETMPEQKTKHKKLKEIKHISAKSVEEQLEELVLHGWIKEYPKTKLKDYIGDPNFVGEDMRRLILEACPHSYEVRALWWEKCLAVSHGSHKILLVGPDGSGKIQLVHAIASYNDAVLFELDPTDVSEEYLTPEYLKALAKHILSCAKATQPSVVHIRQVQKLFYAKPPPEEAELQLELINKSFLQRLLKKIHKRDKITVIGTCSDPWVANPSQLVKKFPFVILLPNTTYSIVVQLLKRWVMKHHSIPCDFDISSLARVLQGYSYGCLQELLDRFMTEERIVRRYPADKSTAIKFKDILLISSLTFRAAAYGISPMDVYNFILEDEKAMKTEYDLYLKWYWEKTPSGKKEKQHMDDMLEYKEAVEAFEKKQAKQAKIAKRHAALNQHNDA